MFHAHIPWLLHRPQKQQSATGTAVRFLGYICDSQRQAFILPHDKRSKYSALREAILRCKTVSLKNLQKFAGKTTSFALLVPAAKLYTNEVFQAISKAGKSRGGRTSISPLRYICCIFVLALVLVVVLVLFFVVVYFVLCTMPPVTRADLEEILDNKLSPLQQSLEFISAQYDKLLHLSSEHASTIKKLQMENQTGK